MTIEINDWMKKHILSLSDEYDRMLENGDTDFCDIGDDCINVVCKLADIIKENK